MKDPAIARFFVLQAIRLFGALLALAGVIVLSGRLEAIPPTAGYVLFVAGAAEFFAVPRLFAKRWKSKG